ncbi:hypothetical protein [Streptomyces sp. NPDC088812]|uniref:hypothetical protein n=1 Tax=Streptomyces sp. NPDC088812 TaxID=3365905 RepID=UPI003825B32B
MNDEHGRPTPDCTLTDFQRARVNFARIDLETARTADLAQLDAAGLILLVEKLRRRLDETLHLVDEITQPGQSPQQNN